MPDTTLVGACAGCPYQRHCHSARQRAVEASGLGLGRHTLCGFYREFERRASAAADLVADHRRGGAGLREALCRMFARARDPVQDLRRLPRREER